MVKLSLSSWFSPSGNDRDENHSKKENRQSFSRFNSRSTSKSVTMKNENNNNNTKAAVRQEKDLTRDHQSLVSTGTSASEVVETETAPVTQNDDDDDDQNEIDNNTNNNTPSMVDLADKIRKETVKLEKYMKENGLPMPSFDADAADDFPRLPQDIQKSRLEIIHATKQLRDLTVGPRESLRWGVWDFLDVLALQVINNYKLANLVPLDKPITLVQLQTLTPLDPVNLARILRIAMTNHIFTEPSPGLVAHTAASRLLATDTELAAWIGFNAEDIFPSAAGVLPALRTYPEATSLTRSGFQFAFDTVDVEPMFATFGKDADRARRMGRAMASLTGGEGYEVAYFVDTYRDYLAEVDARAGTFVDIGGSHGFVCVDLARKWKHVRFVVQDLQKTVDSAPRPVCEDQQVNERIEFMAHDFFTEQKVEADVYYFRWIMHNYSTPYAITILKNLIPALKPGARVIINDHCLREPGQENPWDEKIMRRMDIVMLTLLNAQERTEVEFRELFRSVDERFVFKGVTRAKGCRMSIVEAVWQPDKVDPKSTVVETKAEKGEEGDEDAEKEGPTTAATTTTTTSAEP